MCGLQRLRLAAAAGIMMTQIRPVDCNSKTPLTFTPGYVDKVIYDDGVPHAGQ